MYILRPIVYSRYPWLWLIRDTKHTNPVSDSEVAKQGTHGSSAIFQYSFQRRSHYPNTQILLVILVTLATALQGPRSPSANTHFDDQMDTLEAQTGHTKPPKQSSIPRGSHTATEPPTAQRNKAPKDSRGCLRAKDPNVRVTYTNTHVPGHTF